MNLAVVVNVTAIAVVAACLASSAVVRANSIANRYGKQQLVQKQNRYGNAALSSSSLPSLSWFNGGAGNRIAADWTSPYGGGDLMRHYPVSMARYPAAMMVDSRQGGAVYADDYYDGNAVSPYDPRLQLLQQYDGADDDDRSDDYAVVKYPSYGAAGYYPLSDFAAYDTMVAGDDVLYDDMAIVPSASYYLQPSAAAAATAAVNRYDTPPPPPPPRSPLSLSLTNPRYEPAARHPTDKIHKFRKVFMSNVVSPSNAFKSTKEQQLYDFWESLVNDRGLDGIRMDDDAETAGQRHQQPHLQGRHAPVESSDAISQLYQHLPPIFQQLLHKQQQQQQQTIHKPFLQHQPQTADERPSSLPSSSSLSLASPQHAAAPTGNHYKQWANGSPLIKRGMAARRDGYDDVRQLEKLKTRNATAAPPNSVTTTTTTTTTATVVMSDHHVTTPVVAPMMADGGQREYVLPRPAGEKSGIESLLEVIAEGGLKGHLGENSYSKIREEAKVNKKRSFVSDETSLAAQLGALRKN